MSTHTALQVQNEFLGRRVSGLGKARSFDRLNRLPKCCIQNLYRTLVCAPRNEAKCDLISVLYSRYRSDDSFWLRVADEEDFAAKRTQSPVRLRTRPTNSRGE